MAAQAVPTVEEKAAALVDRVELVGRSQARGVAVWWCPASGATFYVVVRIDAAPEGEGPRWWCDCAHGEHHPGAASCSHVRACQLWLERREARR